VADVLVDTDVFVDHLRGARTFTPGGDRIAYSVITRCELFAGKATEESRIRELLAPFQEIAVDRLVAELAGRIRRETRILTPDALVAATALVHRRTLVTRSLRDFEPVPRLRVRAPYAGGDVPLR